MLQYILGTMLASGIVGGLINSYLSDPKVEKPLAWWQHIIVGVGASFIVPVFLNMISSRLIAEIVGPEVTSETLSKLLVLAGFCLLAAVSSRTFIRSMTDRWLKEITAAKKEAKEAKERAENAEVIAEASARIEPEVPAEPQVASFEQMFGLPLSTETPGKKILKAMVDSRFSMRSLAGIAKDVQLSTAMVDQFIGSLLQKGLIAEGKNREGQLRWYPTAAGRQVADGS